MPTNRTKQIGKPLLLVVISLSMLGTGCQSLNKTPSVFSRIGVTREKDATPEFQQPHRMATIWKETAVTARPGAKATRGFGGRVYFYGAENKPVRVDGELVVYAFDDTSSGPDNSARIPDRKYVFRASDFQKHYSQTNIGASYSIWIPWDEIGGELTTVSLLPVFQPVDGTVVQAGQSIAVLPGKEASDSNKVDLQTASIGVRKASANLSEPSGTEVARAGGTTEDIPRRRTTTISVPRGLGNQLKQINHAGPRPNSAVRGHSRSATDADIGEFVDAQPLDPVEQRLYDRLRAEDAETRRLIDPKRPVVFGSPGPVR